MKPALQGKVVLLTGGSAGIGGHCARAYAAEGVRVAILANAPAGVKKAADRLGAGHLGIFGDVSQREQVREAVERTLARYGRLDAVHNNAGIASPSRRIFSAPILRLRRNSATAPARLALPPAVSTRRRAGRISCMYARRAA